jgi:hypothetical protein
LRLLRPGFVTALKRKLPLSRQAHWAAAVLPVTMHFRFALAASRWQARLTRAMGGNGALTEALMRDHWLREFTLQGPFPVPWRLHGRDVLDRYAVPGPALYCTTHIPLNEVPLRALMEGGYPVPIPVADPGRVVGNGEYLITGMTERIPAIPVNGRVLARVRTLLLQGSSVVCLADGQFGGEFSANPLRLAARLHVPVILAWAELSPDGTVEATFHEAPHPYCETEEAIEENLNVLRAVNDRILLGLGVTPQR